jgi:quercetin dioxygenase-like cupin family protein
MGKYDWIVADKPMPNAHEKNAQGETIRRNVIQLNDGIIPGAPYFMMTWYNMPIGPIPEEHVHDFDEYVGFIGTDPENTAELGGTVRFFVGGKWLEIKKSAIVFIPAGVTHCPYFIKDVKKPILHFSGGPAGMYNLFNPSEATRIPDNPEDLVSYRTRPVIPGRETPDSIMRKIVWIDDCHIKGAPYFEIMLFIKPREPLPPTHIHDFDELIGFIGSDPEKPDELGGTVRFSIEDEWLELTKSSVIHVPAGLRHSPFIIEKMSRPIIHFSGGPNVSDKIYDFDLTGLSKQSETGAH